MPHSFKGQWWLIYSFHTVDGRNPAPVYPIMYKVLYISTGAGCLRSTWSNYSDLTRPHPKWWLSKGNLLISGKSGLVKYHNLARSTVGSCVNLLFPRVLTRLTSLLGGLQMRRFAERTREHDASEGPAVQGGMLGQETWQVG